MGNNPVPTPAPEIQLCHKDIGSRLAVVEYNLKAGNWRVRRFLGRKERLRIWADSDLVRPQQYLVGRRR